SGAYNVALDLSGELAKAWTAQAHEKLYVATGDHLQGIDFTLIPGAVITGKVTAVDNGQPVAGAHVSVYGPAHPRSGAWVLGEQEVYGPVTLRARHGSMGTRKGVIAQGGDVVTLRLEPNALAALSGRVTDAAGQPLAGAPVGLIEWTYDSGTESAKTTADAQ